MRYLLTFVHVLTDFTSLTSFSAGTGTNQVFLVCIGSLLNDVLINLQKSLYYSEHHGPDWILTLHPVCHDIMYKLDPSPNSSRDVGAISTW